MVTSTALYVQIPVSSTIPVRDGYTFKGWANTRTGRVVYNYGNSATIAQGADNTKTIYAIWEAHVHSWGEWTSNGNGTHTRTCSTDSSHTETNDCSGGEPTCTEKAICENCHAAYGNPLGHYFEWMADSKQHWKQCVQCHASETKMDHSGGTATCTQKAVCEICITAYGNPLGHDFTSQTWQSDADNHWKKCSRCDAIDSENGHDWDSGEVTIKPTCTTAGQKTFTCAVCSAIHLETIGAFGHTFVRHNAKAATCTEKGWKAYDTCSRCDYTTYAELQHLKSNPETNNIPVIIMSALSDMQSIVKGYQLGATEYVTKPFQREELVKRVAHRYELFSIKRIKQELENTIESRDTLYSVIAHDLRSPLGSLKMMNNAILMMVDKNQVSDEVYEMLQMMNKTSEEIFQLLDNLLKWAKNRLNKQNIYRQQVDINSIVNSTAEIFIPMATQKGISIMLEGLDKELMGSTDIDMVKTIVRNLISNAVKFSYEKGLITVSTKTDGDFVVVSVKDSGKGIKKEDQGKLLRPNTHFTSYGTNNEKGSGLGLMLCKDFVEQLGGKLWFDSEEGKGTTFYFSLKVSNQE